VSYFATLSSKFSHILWLEGSKPLLHSPYLKQMRLLDEIRLCVDIQNAIAVPVMSCTRDQICGAEIRGLAGFSVFGMDTNIEPRIDTLGEISRCGFTKGGRYSLPSTKARRSAARLYPPYTLSLSRSGVGGIELYLPLGKAHVHHCCLGPQC